MAQASSHDPRRVRIATATTQKGAATIMELEIELSSDMPSGFSVVGFDSSELPSRECYIRVRSALQASHLPFPSGRIRITTSTERMVLDSAFDLAVALGLLVLQGMVPHDAVSDIVAVGELSLSGYVNACRGVLPLVVEAACRTPRPIVLVPACNGEEAALVDRTHFAGVAHLSEVRPLLAGTAFRPSADLPDLSEIEGMGLAKRALAISAAGRHHLLLVGPPGCGKTMLARRLPALLPPLSREEALEVTALYSLAGAHPAGASYIAARPFRAAHHTVSELAMLGGGRPLFRAGEISLAHRGVLFLDEATEFTRRALHGVGLVVSGSPNVGPIGRRADVLCAAAVTPCPCGWWGHATRDCHCTDVQVGAHRARLSPLLEYLDMIEVDLTDAGPHESVYHPSTEVTRERVVVARERQRRDGRIGPEAYTVNAQLDATRLLNACSPGVVEMVGSEPGIEAMELLGVLRVARTIADLEDSDEIRIQHVDEARLFQRSWR